MLQYTIQKYLELWDSNYWIQILEVYDLLWNFSDRESISRKMSLKIFSENGMRGQKSLLGKVSFNFSAFSVGYVGVKMFGVGVKHAATIVLV